MRLLVLGATGLLGQAVMACAARRGVEAVGAAREGADAAVDVVDADALAALVGRTGADVVVNCAALVDLRACEADPGAAYRVNARPAAIVAEAVTRFGGRLVQVSTDHYWTGDRDRKHDERAPVRLLNEYARAKLAGEALALARGDSLVVRTNIVGVRGWADRPTFAEWALDMLESGRQMTLFEDFYTSSFDAPSCAAALLDLVDAEAVGLLNVASSEVASKRAFVEALADAAGLPAPPAQSGSVAGLEPARAESLGLDVARAESILGRRLPGLTDVARAVVAERREWS